MVRQDLPGKVGVIGAGSFGTAITMLLSHNVDVLLYARNPEKVKHLNEAKTNLGISFSDRVVATNDLQELGENCHLIFPIVPSNNFRDMIRQLGPHLRPNHILIHGTKGFDTATDLDFSKVSSELLRKNVHTMSQVIRQESVVVRIGCLAGPNLAKEIMEGQPTASVIASSFDEVVRLGQEVLRSKSFQVFGTNDILGAELAGVLKNLIAIGCGILAGKGFGRNIQAILINRGLLEMIHFGQSFGADYKAFLGTAGIGDLIATSTSRDSRNFTFGYRLGSGEQMEETISSMPELAEGIRTLKIVHHLAKSNKLRVPIMEMLYNIVFENFNVDRAIDFLISYPYGVDVDFI